MEGAVVDKIQGLVEKGTKFEIDGRTYLSGGFKEVKQYDDFPDPFGFSDLQGICRMLKEVNDFPKGKIFIIVDDETSVSVYSDFNPRAAGGRVFLGKATVDQRIKPFRFGEYMKVEDLMIALHTRFDKTKDVGELTEFLSQIKSTSEVVETDDGVSQNVITTVGTVAKRETKAPLIVALKPFRSFPEITPVESKFMFRMKKDGNTPAAVLLETDGGQWVNDTRDVIRNYLEREKPQASLGYTGPEIVVL